MLLVTAGAGFGSGSKRSWDFSGAEYTVTSFGGSLETTSALDLSFNQTGTKLYVLGNSSPNINTLFQYSVSNPWDASSASYDSISYASTIGTAPSGLFVNDNGLKLFITDTQSDNISQHTFSTAFATSTLSADAGFLSSSSETTKPVDIFIKPDGLKLYILSLTSPSAVLQYSLTTAFASSTASYDGVSFSYGGVDARTFYFNQDGTTFYITDFTNVKTV